MQPGPQAKRGAQVLDLFGHHGGVEVNLDPDLPAGVPAGDQPHDRALAGGGHAGQVRPGHTRLAG
jgi:hypothetical protein